LPLPSVVPEVGLTAPQEPVLLAVRVKVTVSPTTLALVTPFFTFAVTTEVSAPLAATLVFVAVTATTFGTAVCVMVAELLRPPLDSVAVTVQVPTVVVAV
jgi:hypothetical protein